MIVEGHQELFRFSAFYSHESRSLLCVPVPVTRQEKVDKLFAFHLQHRHRIHSAGQRNKTKSAPKRRSLPGHPASRNNAAKPIYEQGPCISVISLNATLLN